jgi:hypothetical protein
MAISETIRDMEGAKVQRIQVDDLAQHLATLEQELSEGRSIELARGETVFAEVRAKTSLASEDKPWIIPDFLGQMREAFGDQVFPIGTALSWIDEDRGPK